MACQVSWALQATRRHLQCRVAPYAAVLQANTGVRAATQAGGAAPFSDAAGVVNQALVSSWGESFVGALVDVRPARRVVRGKLVAYLGSDENQSSPNGIYEVEPLSGRGVLPNITLPDASVRLFQGSGSAPDELPPPSAPGQPSAAPSASLPEGVADRLRGFSLPQPFAEAVVRMCSFSPLLERTQR